MAESITKEDLKVLSRDIKEGFREELRENTREIIGHFNKSQVVQNERMDKMDKRFDSIDERFNLIDEQLKPIAEDVAKVKLAVLDLLATDRHLHNLVRELQRQGIAINTEKIFAT